MERTRNPRYWVISGNKGQKEYYSSAPVSLETAKIMAFLRKSANEKKVRIKRDNFD